MSVQFRRTARYKHVDAFRTVVKRVVKQENVGAHPRDETIDFQIVHNISNRMTLPMPKGQIMKQSCI
jgi:hypothetical protein